MFRNFGGPALEPPALVSCAGMLRTKAGTQRKIIHAVKQLFGFTCDPPTPAILYAILYEGSGQGRAITQRCGSCRCNLSHQRMPVRDLGPNETCIPTGPRSGTGSVSFGPSWTFASSGRSTWP